MLDLNPLVSEELDFDLELAARTVAIPWDMEGNEKLCDESIYFLCCLRTGHPGPHIACDGELDPLIVWNNKEIWCSKRVDDVFDIYNRHEARYGSTRPKSDQ